MDNIRESIKILFNSTYLDEKIEMIQNDSNKNYEEFYFFNYKKDFYHNSKENYSYEEVDRLETLLKNEWLSKNKNIFYLLIEYSKDLLIEKNNELLCKYSKLFKWRELTLEIGEDILTTSYLAYNDVLEGYNRENFDWSWILKTDNIELRNILSKGVSENHFHLMGSSPYFDIFWIYFMNGILIEDNDKGLRNYIKKIENSLNPLKKSNVSKDSFEIFDLLIIAGMIRSYLYFSLNKKDNKEWKKRIDEFIKEKDIAQYKEYKKVLKNEIELEYEKVKNINERDDIIKKIDYVSLNFNINENQIFSSERKFLYKIFKESFKDSSCYEQKNKLLYIYLLIKNKIKKELMYHKKMYGLDDFIEFNKRKNHGGFLPKQYVDILYNEILKNTFKYQQIKDLEIRVGFNDIGKNIIRYDNKLKANENSFFYVLHYFKESDNFKINYESHKDLTIDEYIKDKTYREKIKEETINFIKLYREGIQEKVLDRILGVDATGREFNCKPEVFGQAYRSLRKLSRHKKLWFTYHVGEDFIDLTSGLRSIDEAVLFLELEAYDRLGHALALGIKPSNFYLKKNSKLLLKKGELLDNISWLLMNIRVHNIEFEDNPKEILEIKYKELIEEVYYSSVNSIIYSEIWELRGDATLYDNSDLEESYWRLSIEREPQNKKLKRIRKMVDKNNEYKNLFNSYFKDYDVNNRYNEIVEFEIPKGYIELVKRVQYIMQKKIKEKRICIETNPTSNYLISSLSKYEDHPIKNFFNIGLGERKIECPQLHVSINTDDQGIFYTCLENEYALVALSLEKLKDQNGNHIYNSYEVYEWIDKIREMGLQQSFANR